ncbi:MAG: glycosyltransferase family 9 protein [Proteobacteria bacterium]|nr:glycosyltransferase family 9 protein [Pseudomonadota bacterium]
MKAPTVIVMSHNGLGDIVMTLPLLDRIDRALPVEGRLIIVTKSALEENFLRLFQWRHSPEILTVGIDRSFRGIFRVSGVALKLRGTNPDVFIAGVMPDSLFASLFARLIGARLSIGQEGKWRRLGFSVGHAWPEGEHKTSYFARFADLAGCLPPNGELTYPTLKPVARAEATSGERLVLLSPGSQILETHKRWPAKSFAELATRLLTQFHDIRIGIFGGIHEQALLQEIANGIGSHPRCEILAPPRVEDSLAIIRQAECVVSGCSGSMHLATLLGRPVVGIYGPTNPSITGPYSDKAVIVRLGLACSPCYRPQFTAGCGNPICMTMIDVARVQSAVIDSLSGCYGPFPRKIKSTQATAPSAAIVD